MNRFRRVIAAAVLTLPFSASAAEKYATTATVEKDQASLAVSSADCADNPECVAATLACRETGAFAIGVNGVEGKDAAAMVKDLKATLAADAKSFALLPQKLTFSEMDGAWEVELGARENATEAWKALMSAKKVTLSLGGHKLAFSGDKNLAKVAKACLK
jgi:hypothetical protein